MVTNGAEKDRAPLAGSSFFMFYPASVSLSVNRITQRVVDEFWRNLWEGRAVEIVTSKNWLDFVCNNVLRY